MERYARGPNFTYAKEWVISKFGQATWDKSLKLMPEEHAKVWEGVLLMVGTYSFESFKALIPALAQATGGKSTETLSEMYSYAADRSLNMVFKMFFRVTSPGFVIGNYPQLWKKFFTVGAVQASEVTDSGALLCFHLPAIFRDWIEPACLGFSTKAVQLAGAKSLQQRVLSEKPLPNGDFEINIRLSWSK